jgi:hemolysin III
MYNDDMSQRENPHGLQTVGEEIANSVSHGIGLVLALAGASVLIVAEMRTGSVWSIVGAGVFASTMVTLYLASTLYHALGPHELPKTGPLPEIDDCETDPAGGKAKRFFRLLDHGAVFLLIAGTYTPFTLGVMRGPWGWTLLCLVWAMAVAGITVKALCGTRYMWLSIVLYVTMGWLILIAVKPVLERVPLAGLAWLLAGGIAYTGGLGFFAAHRLRYNHFIWHLCVIAGTVCHFFAVLWYAS